MLVGRGGNGGQEGTEKGDVMGEMGPTRQQVAEVATGLVVVMREMEDRDPRLTWRSWWHSASSVGSE